MSEENLNEKFEKEFDKLSEKDKREVNNLIRFMHEKKYHDSQYEELLNQYIELSRDYDKLENIIEEAREYINNHQLVFEISSKKQIAYWFDMFYKELLEILDKKNKGE